MQQVTVMAFSPVMAKRIRRYLSVMLRWSPKHENWPPCSALKLDVELDHLIRLGIGGFDPILHRRQRPDRLAIGGAVAVEVDIISEEARYHRREHGVGHAGFVAEQERTFASGEALAP